MDDENASEQRDLFNHLRLAFLPVRERFPQMSDSEFEITVMLPTMARMSDALINVFIATLPPDLQEAVRAERHSSSDTGNNGDPSDE